MALKINVKLQFWCLKMVVSIPQDCDLTLMFKAMGIEVPIFRGCIYAYFQTNLNGDKT
jgi:hypothetical protein